MDLRRHISIPNVRERNIQLHHSNTGKLQPPKIFFKMQAPIGKIRRDGYILRQQPVFIFYLIWNSIKSPSLTVTAIPLWEDPVTAIHFSKKMNFPETLFPVIGK